MSGFTRSLRMALLLSTVSLGAGLAAAAEETKAAPNASSRFVRADADKSGDVSLSEFTTSNDRYLAGADANGDGRMTADEIADEIVRVRAERLADQLVKRLDTDGDGMVSRAEVEAGQKPRFAKLDKNGDGKLTPDEMPGPKSRQPRS